MKFSWLSYSLKLPNKISISLSEVPVYINHLLFLDKIYKWTLKSENITSNFNILLNTYWESSLNAWANGGMHQCLVKIHYQGQFMFS